MHKVRIDIISDVVCPWCYLGKARLDKAITLVESKHEVSLHWHPYELNPDMPLEGMPYTDYLTQKFGGGEKVDKIIENLTHLGKDAGIDFQFSDIGRIPNTFQAHRLLFLSAGQSQQSVLADKLFSAYFRDGEDVGDKDFLAQTALELDLPVKVIREFTNSPRGTEEIQTLEEDYRESGINAVPTYIFNQQYIVQGAQETDVFMQIFDKLAMIA